MKDYCYTLVILLIDYFPCTLKTVTSYPLFQSLSTSASRGRCDYPSAFLAIDWLHYTWNIMAAHQLSQSSTCFPGWGDHGLQRCHWLFPLNLENHECKSIVLVIAYFHWTEETMATHWLSQSSTNSPGHGRSRYSSVVSIIDWFPWWGDLGLQLCHCLFPLAWDHGVPIVISVTDYFPWSWRITTAHELSQ